MTTINGIPMVFLRRCGKVLLYRSRYGWCESFTEQQSKDALSPSRRGYGGGGARARAVTNHSGVK